MNIALTETYNLRLFFYGSGIMRLLRGLHNPGLDKPGCVATIGNFDGVHLGHQHVLAQLLEKAESLSLPSVVILFEPQPLEYFQPDTAPARLMCLREKLEALQGQGIDTVCCLRFNENLRRQSAEEFIDQVLVNHLHIRHLVIGDDFRFGGDRQGDYVLLKSVGEARGFSVDNSSTYAESAEAGALRISSTEIRKALAENDFGRAQRLLGKPFSISGRVLHGQKLGRDLGFPTANLALRRRISPLMGVFAVRVHRASGLIQGGVANIGTKPSVGQFQPNLEVHIFDLNEDLYGERIQVEFIAKLRDEQRFDGLEALRLQIKKDSEAARRVLNENSACSTNNENRT